VRGKSKWGSPTKDHRGKVLRADDGAWTWAELRRVERARGDRFVAFLRAYGRRGALALELTRTVPARRRCALHALTGGSCEGCGIGRQVPVIGPGGWTCAPPWTATGRAALVEAYREALQEGGRMPKRGAGPCGG
jgi:hypothetical protein